MKKLLILLLFPIITFAQTGVTQHAAWYSGAGEPKSVSTTIFPGISTGKIYLDTLTGSTWMFQVNPSRWVVKNAFPKVKGDPGPQGPQGDPGLSVTGPMGPQGPPGVCPSCPPSGGTQGRTFITPHLLNDFGQIVVGGSNSTQTVAGAGVNPSVYAGITVLSTDLYDWANLQYAMYLEQQTSKPIELYSIFRGVNKMIDPGSYNMRLELDGNFAQIVTTSGGFPVLGSQIPRDLADANVMVNRLFVISNLEINCSNSQIAIDLGPQYGSRYNSIIVSGALTAIHVRFGMNCVIEGCFATNCINGFIYDHGNFPGATPNNSCSNGSVFRNDRCYMPSNGNVGFGIYAADGVLNESCIVEGGKCKRGIDVDGKGSATMVQVIIMNFHPEYATIGDLNTEAAVYVRMCKGQINVSFTSNTPACMLINAGNQVLTSGNAGYLTINVSNIPYWNMQSGKMFYNAASATSGTGNKWNINNVEISPTTLMSAFAGQPVTQFCGWGGGVNVVCITPK